MRILLALLLCLVALDASAASFPCAKAKSKVEKLICADPVLSKLDEDLAAAFKKANTDWDATANDQRAWLQQVRNRCATGECLASAYRKRIEVLEHWHDPAPWSDQMQGQYLEPHKVRFYSESGDEVEDSSDCVSITPEPDGSMRLRVNSLQGNGFSCTVSAKARKVPDGYRTIPGDNDSCELTLRVERGTLVIEDPQNTCERSCGAHARLDGLAFGRTHHEPGRCQLMSEDL